MNAELTTTAAETQDRADVRRTAPIEPGVSTTLGQADVEMLAEGDSATLALRGAIRKVLERASERCPDLASALSEVLTIVGDMRSQRALGSFSSEKWQLTSGTVLHEVLVSSRHLSSDADEVAHSLLHELAHLLAHVRGLRDCSNRGRYHNRKFKDCAEELGLIVERCDHYGYVTKGLSCQLREYLAPEIQGLRRAMTIRLNDSAIDASVDEITEVAEESQAVQRKYVSALCQCTPPRVIRVALGHWMGDSIGCLLCRSFFFDPEGASTDTSGQSDGPIVGAMAVTNTSASVIPHQYRSGPHG